MSAATFDALVLNADFRPLSYRPLSLWSWQDAVHAVILDRVSVVETYDRVIRSPSFEIQLPSVVALKDYQPLTRHAPMTRLRVYVRDNWTCCYCGKQFRTDELTFDHVLPRSRGGRTTWENVVTCCQACNLRKANRTPDEAHMALLRRPYRPTLAELNREGRRHSPAPLHRTWADYLYWDSALQE